MPANADKASEAAEPHATGPRRPRSRRLGMWFGVGFLLVFAMMALCITMHALSASGAAVTQCPLWKYYVIEFRRQLTATTLGPATSGGSTVIETLFFHVLISVLGGGLLVGARLLMGKITGRRKTNTT
jgi:hypothetical protein